MNIEEAIEIIEDKKDMFIDTLFECYRQNEVKSFNKAIETLLTAYEKEKEKNWSNSFSREEMEQALGTAYKHGKEHMKDKIKAKIEECEKKKNIPYEMDFKAFYRIKDLKNIEINILQSLLEEEEK